MSKHPLHGSERKPLPGARAIGKADPSERLEVSVLVKRSGAEALTGMVAKLVKGDKSGGHMKREEFAEQFGADPAGVAAVKKFANAHGLAVVQENAASRTIVLSGTVAQFNEAFGVDLEQFEHKGGSYRGRTGSLQLPDELEGVVDAVLGLDNRPQAKPHFRARPIHGNVQWHSSPQGLTSFYPTQLASLYNFPNGAGQGECIAIIELGGGYRPADISQYFSEINTTPPKVVAISVDHGRNRPTGDQNGPDGEVMLDIEVAGAIAPAANIAVYFTPNTDAGFLDAINSALHDTTNKPTVISISWGGPESSWTQQAMISFDQAFQAGIAMGVTVCVASGDDGSSDGVNDGANHVDFPASSPNVLACGGTSLQAATGSITSEIVWNDGANGGASGGGVSDFFALPAWQQGLTITNSQGAGAQLQARGVPDVSGDADPKTGYDVRVDGNDTVIGGTSAVAPLWAGMIARINSLKGAPVGFINPQLYKNAGALNDITQGNNGSFAASAGWDACTGLGSPNGKNVAKIV
jgi:kumamolisin